VTEVAPAPVQAASSVPVSISTGPGAGRPLTYREAIEPPCLHCATSPCCTYLLLRDFQMDTIMDVDYATFLLNFDGIVLGLQKDRKVDVYLYQPCGNLDVDSGLCRVHGTKLQPAVCVHYKSHTCSYRHVFTTDLNQDKPLLDSRRMAWLAEQIVFDDDRKVIGFPEWDDVLQGFMARPTERRPAQLAGPDPVLEQWRAIVLSPKPDQEEDTAGPFHHFSDPQVTDPCDGCGAWCCKALVFDRGIPADASQVEFLRYCIGFPNVEIGVADNGWAVIVHTTCRHLSGNRCSVYGQPERPLKCGYYDALSCAYRGHFGVPAPDDVVRVARHQFATVADSIVFDDLGRIVAIPPLHIVRERVIQAERAAAATNGQTS
jgi:hypothetical protein